MSPEVAEWHGLEVSSVSAADWNWSGNIGNRIIGRVRIGAKCGSYVCIRMLAYSMYYLTATPYVCNEANRCG